MPTNLGTAYVSVMPSMKGFGSALESGMNMPSEGAKAGAKFSGSFSNQIKTRGAAIAGAIGGVVSSATTKAMDAISSSIGSAVSRVDTLNNFPKIMSNMNIGADAAQAAIDKVNTAIDRLPTTLDSAVSSVQRFTMKTSDVNKSADYFVAVNDAILAGAAPMEVQSSALEQLSQAFSKNKMDSMEWRSIQQAMPAQLKQIADSMNISVDQLGEGLKKGSISMDTFMEKIVELDKNGTNGFKSFAEQAKNSIDGIQTNAANFRTAITRNVANAINQVKPQIVGFLQWGKDAVNSFGAGANEFLGGLVSNIDFAGFEAAASGIASAFASAFPEDGGTAKTFGEQVSGIINSLIPALQMLEGPAHLAGMAINALSEHPEVVTILIGVGIGMKAIQAASEAATLLQTAGSAIAGIAGKATAAAGGTMALAAAERAEGAAAAGSVGQTLAMGAAILMIGGGVALACVGMALLAQSAIAISEAGPMAGVAMLGMVAGVAALAGVMYLAAPALTAGAVGMLAFGAAVLLVGVGVLAASAGITMLSGALPMIATYGAVAAGGMFAVGAAAVTMGALVMAGGALVLAGGALALAGGGMFIAAGGLMVAGGALMLAGGALAVAFGALMFAAIPGVAALNLAIGDLGDKVGSIGWGFQAAATYGTAAAAALFLLAGAAPQVAGGLGQASTAASTLGSSMSTVAPSMSAAASSTVASMAIMSAAVVGAVAQMQSAIKGADLTIQVKMGPLPHFYYNGTFDPQTNSVPTVGVNWYGKGGYFDSPSVIGIGEAGKEVAMPLNDHVFGEIADGIRNAGGAAGTQNVNIYIDGSSDPDATAQAVAFEMRRLMRMGA